MRSVHAAAAPLPALGDIQAVSHRVVHGGERYVTREDVTIVRETRRLLTRAYGRS